MMNSGESIILVSDISFTEYNIDGDIVRELPGKVMTLSNRGGSVLVTDECYILDYGGIVFRLNLVTGAFSEVTQLI
jgi:hypothetical protein